MTKARQKGVQKVNEMKIKAHKNKWGPLRVHRMNWKVRFRELTGWRPKNDEEWMKNVEERLKIFPKIPTETLWKPYGSASAWIFFTEPIFFTNIKWFLNYQEGWKKFLFTSPPNYKKMGEMLATQLAQVSKVTSSRSNSLLEESSGGPKWAWLLFAPPLLLNTPLPFFSWFFFRKVTETYEFRNDTCFLSVMLRNLANYIIIPFLTHGMLRNLTNCATMLPFEFRHVTELHELPNDGCQVPQNGQMKVACHQEKVLERN